MQAEITICTLDRRAIEDSQCYLTLVQELGPEAANKWTEVVLVPLGSDDS